MPRPRAEKHFLGIDGEGIGRRRHRYNLLARAGINGTHAAYVEAPDGARLTTVQCLDFILKIPASCRVFSFAFQYDLTHILRDLPNGLLYSLLHPESRTGKKGPEAVVWRGYRLNLVSRKFTVKKGRKKTVIWDIFAFFQCRFTTALQRWGVATEAELESMIAMKSARSEFSSEKADEIRAYCLDECAKLGELAKRLVQAHIDADLRLRQFYGAGSTASVALKRWKINTAVRMGPPEIDRAVASAFFGGRFENSRIGPIDGPVYGYDISSAYPYQSMFLPCLECGTWAHTHDEGEARAATIACVRYSLPAHAETSWGPYPFRLDDGSITFPRQSGGGWIWAQEFFAGKKMFAKTKFQEAWTYTTTCEHRPFAGIAKMYVQRLLLGKEAAGITLKLAVNSVYGKLAQSVGDAPPFQSWIWAGLITSGCRAQLLDLMGRHKSLSSVVMVATDGLYSTENIIPPKPRETGTMTGHKKPLGGWEKTVIGKGLIAVRPGVYFPQHPTAEELEKIRARGVGRAEMLAQWQRVTEALAAGEPKITLGKITRFHGAKSTLHKSKSGINRAKNYGQWSTQTMELSFSPLPKRAKIMKNGSLKLRAFPALESLPYDPSVLSGDALALKSATEIAAEQPDGVGGNFLEE